jgi:hypothetical protein
VFFCTFTSLNGCVACLALQKAVGPISDISEPDGYESRQEEATVTFVKHPCLALQQS